MTRYLRDVYAMSKASGYGKSFKEFCVESLAEDKKRIAALNASNPVEYDRTFRLGCDHSMCGMPEYVIHVFKRKGMDWSFHEMDPHPNGGEGYVSREDAIERIRNLGSAEDIAECDKF